MRRLSPVTATVAAGALALAAVTGCSAASAGSSSIAPTGAYVQQPTATGKATVGYLDIRNNGAADKLLSVTTSAGGTVALRGPVRPDASPVLMHTVRDIPIPANSMTQLVPNSYHLLITGAGPMRDGKDITLRLRFAHAGTVTVLALVTNPGGTSGGYF
ncbi:MAG: copper chaperone PCu(A)C [Nocardiopsaceae bacterium]|nr:copper chaperone PCu(A)C [Nocardiopsaceae bacterium]